MRKLRYVFYFLAVAIVGSAQNPIIQTNYTAEPSSMGKREESCNSLFVTSIQNGDYIKVQGVDFSSGVTSIDVSVASLYGGKIEIHTDKMDGPVLGIINVNTSGEGDIWKTISTPIKNNIQGVYDVYFVFRGEKDLFNFDWWQCKGKIENEDIRI